MKRLAALGCTSLVLAGCSGASDEELRQEIADGVQRIADGIADEVLGTAPPVPHELGSGITVSPGSPVFAEESTDTLEELLPDGDEAFAPISAVVQRDFDESQITLPDAGVAYVKDISSDGANGFKVTFAIKGTETMVEFAASGWNDSGWYKFDDEDDIDADAGEQFSLYCLWSETDSFDNASNRTSGPSALEYFDIIGWGVVAPDYLLEEFYTLNGYYKWYPYDAYATYGVRTSSENLPAGSATYEGTLRARIWNEIDLSYDGTTRVRGDLTLNAGFDNSAIDGQVDGLRTQPGDVAYNENFFTEMAAGNSFDISNGVIRNGQFKAEWSGEDDNFYADPQYSTAGFSGSMLGEFYGPAGEEVGGVMSGYRATTAATPDEYIHGGFGAKKQVEAIATAADAAVELE